MLCVRIILFVAFRVWFLCLGVCHILWCTSGSNGYPQSMFLSKNKENNEYPHKLHFSLYKVGLRGVFITQTCQRDVLNFHDVAFAELCVNLLVKYYLSSLVHVLSCLSYIVLY